MRSFSISHTFSLTYSLITYSLTYVTLGMSRHRDQKTLNLVSTVLYASRILALPSHPSAPFPLSPPPDTPKILFE